MNNYKIVLQYEGTKYQGWQKQDKTDNTIQGKLEALISKMVGYEVEVNGSGRTDAGVHARGQIANFKLEKPYSPSEIVIYMNRYLPEDIRVIECREVDERFHSRLNSKRKTYSYRIWNDEIANVFERRFTWQVPDKLDVDAMKKASEILLGTHDFKAFTSSKKGNKSTVRTISKIEIIKNGSMIAMMFHGDGFLYHMVRIITGTLVEVGLSKRSVESVKDTLESLDREHAGMLAPALGLCLENVEYDR